MSSSNYDPTIFDSLYPDEEGSIEARKRLVSHAQHFCRMRRLAPAVWVEIVMKDPEYRYYVTLIGGPLFLKHLAMWVWQPINRSI